jgi:hypothetical protein
MGFQDAFKKWQKRPKLVFDQMAAPVPEIMDDCLHNKNSTGKL